MNYPKGELSGGEIFRSEKSGGVFFHGMSCPRSVFEETNLQMSGSCVFSRETPDSKLSIKPDTGYPDF